MGGMGDPAERVPATTDERYFIFVPAGYGANRVAKVTGRFAHRQYLLQPWRKLQWLGRCRGLRRRELLPTGNRRSIMRAHCSFTLSRRYFVTGAGIFRLSYARGQLVGRPIGSFGLAVGGDRIVLHHRLGADLAEIRPVGFIQLLK